jgi:hypothetical protein
VYVPRPCTTLKLMEVSAWLLPCII